MSDYNDQENVPNNDQNNDQINNQNNVQQTNSEQYQQPQYQQNNYQQPQYQQPQYQQNQYQTQYQNQYQMPQKKSNGMAIASMVLGIISLLLFCIPYFAIPASIVGLILGIISIRGKKDGKGMAIAGIILSSIALLIGVLIIILSAAIASSGLLDEFMNGFNSEFYGY